MSNQYLKLRRSGVPGKIPSTSSIDYGEIALNTYDGVAYMKKSGSSGEEVVGFNSGSFTGNFSGSFSGSGANLSNIPASGIVGFNLSQISSGSFSASISDAGLLVNTRVVANSFTGSLFGTASWAQNAITASFAPSYLPLTGGTVSGSLIVSGSTTLINATGSTVFSSNADTIVITGSLFMTGSATLTGSMTVTGGITGSLFGTASYTLTASYIDGGFY